jgi:hypothetical protein
VRDNLVIYCERSTWQLRYTGNSIAPFQIEKVNTELGCESTFSAIPFDTSLVGIGDKGIVECDSFKSERIDIKIPDLVFEFSNVSQGKKRVQGIRDFKQRLAYWTYIQADTKTTFPNQRLVYNYENQSWAIFNDSFTCFGSYQIGNTRTWSSLAIPWASYPVAWNADPEESIVLVGGNQQGYIEKLDSQISNDASLSITAITGYGIGVAPTRLTIPNHNLTTGQVIQVVNIPAGTPFATSLNNGIFGVVYLSTDQIELWKYDSGTDSFIIPQTDAIPATPYIGAGQVKIRDGFRIVSKKFEALDSGQRLQMGYLDLLADDTTEGEITLKVYVDYHTSPTNTYPENQLEDTFFNTIVPTYGSTLGIAGPNDKNWTRVYCATRGAFLQVEWTLSNGQLVGHQQESWVQIDAQILWMRTAGRITI